MMPKIVSLKPFHELLRLEQTLFGLPFLLAGALLPWLMGSSFDLLFFSVVLIGFFLARISGMAFNQLIDCEIDAKNPRTENRPLPTKRISKKIAARIAWGALFIFLVGSLFLGLTLFLLTLAAGFLLFAYSYFKRFSSSSHFILGIIHALSPLMAFLLMGGEIGLPPFLLSLTALFTIVGSDILYAIADISFDRKEKLYSLPALLGEKRGYQIGRVFHIFALISLFLFGWTLHVAVPFFIASLVGLFFLIHHHRKKERPLLFNGVIGLLTLCFTLGVKLWAAM